MASESISWWDPTIITTVFVWLAMVLFLGRLLKGAHQTGKSVAQLSLLSGGFLIVAVLGPMLLAGSGNLNTFHGRPRSTSSDNSSEKKKDTSSDRPQSSAEVSPMSSTEEIPQEVGR